MERGAEGFPQTPPSAVDSKEGVANLLQVKMESEDSLHAALAAAAFQLMAIQAELQRGNLQDRRGKECVLRLLKLHLAITEELGVAPHPQLRRGLRCTLGG